jgi:hypothetical protein
MSDGPQATISIDQSTLEKALVAHLFGDMLGDEASRSALLTDLVTRIIQEPERSHDKESLLQKSVKEALKERTREIAHEWMARPETEAAIREKVEELLKGEYIKELLDQSVKLIADRLGRGY